ncbi:hypothetical protein SAMN05443253_1058 [Bacillus sp. OK048]|nr:hypothetical protein SAMN05443253_1058 [Bacillus sp. OK048]
MSGMKIGQQVYTRERGGIFHSGDGYDTIAISEDLDQAFVKKYLHPICSYQSPKMMTERGEKDPALYPEALTLIQPETGDLIIGQAVYVPADFTGQRSTFFMDNYIIPESWKDEWIKTPARLFQINSFKTSYDVSMGHVLPEVTELGWDGIDILANKNELLLELGITESLFKQLLFAVMSSIAGKKKVYISLNAELHRYKKMASTLLELIFHYLPFSYRRKLGAMTFTSEPEGKKYVHVMFFEPGTLNYHDRSMEKQYIFDFANQKFSGVDLVGQHEYLNFAWEQLLVGNKLDEFFEFAEKALFGLSEEYQLQVTNYYQLTAIYQTLNGSANFYQQHKLSFLYSLLTFLKVENAVKDNLEQLFLQILKEEKAAVELETAIDFVKAVLEFNQISLHDKGLEFILNTLDYYKSEPIFHTLMELVEGSIDTYDPLMEFITLRPDYTQILDLYLTKKFNLTRVEDILGEINQLLLKVPFLVKNRGFQSLIMKKTSQAISDSSDIFQAASAVKEFRIANQDVDFSKIKEMMMVSTEITLLKALDFKNLTLKDIDTFAYVSTGKLNVKEIPDKLVIRKYKIMRVLHELFNSPVVSVELFLQPLSLASREELRNVLKNVLRNNLSEKYFHHLLAAFNNEDGSFHYPQLFAYISKHGDDDLVLSFIKWTTKNLQLDHHYHRALKKYLKSHPRSIWKNKTAKKELQQISTVSFRKLIKEVQHETASPIVKFFKRYGIHLSIIVLIVLVAGSVGLYLGSDFLGGQKENAADSKSSAASATAKKEAKKQEPSLESFKVWDAENPYVFSIDGQQQQLSFGQANPTGGKSIKLTNNQNVESSFDLIIDSEASPFDDQGVLKENFSLYHTEYDFDKNGTSEVVIMAMNETYESFVWVYSPISENGNVGLRADLAVRGLNVAKLVDNTLELLSDQGQAEKYAYINQQFEKQ